MNTLEFTDAQVFELAGLIQKEWSTAFEDLKNAKSATWESAGKFCPKAEWPLYQATLLNSAQARFDKATVLRNVVAPVYAKLLQG